MAWFRSSNKPAAAPPAAPSLSVTRFPSTAPASGQREAAVRALGLRWMEEAKAAGGPGLFSRQAWADRLMDWACKDSAFKLQMFRFIDVFPSLRDPAKVMAVLADHLGQPVVTLPPGMELGIKLGQSAPGLLQSMAAKTLASQVQGMAERFIAGQDAATALPRLRKLWDADLAFSVDLLGEACVSQVEAEAFAQRYLDLIRNLPAAVAAWPGKPLLDGDSLGPIPRCNVSLKLSSLAANIGPVAFEHSVDALCAAVVPLLEAAAKAGVFINIDMENHALKDLTLAVFRKCCERVDVPAGIALQAYLRDTEADAADLAAWAQRLGRPIQVRLVKGAYWDYETLAAEQAGWPSPVWASKPQSDACFERVAELLLRATPRKPGEGGIKLAVGSHNLRSIAWAHVVAEELGLPSSAIETQMLEGMADGWKRVLAKDGRRVRVYAPIGELLPGMAYLVRRLLENTSNESWLRGGESGADPEKLLRSPHVQPSPEREAQAALPSPSPDRQGGLGGVDLLDDANGKDKSKDTAPLRSRLGRKHGLSRAMPELANGEPFFNEPPRDFANAAQRQAFAQALASAQVPQVKQDHTAADARAAAARAMAAFDGWAATPALDRSRMLLKAAELMRARRDALAGVIVLEAGKTWLEADADVCEAIDFCEYYARQAPALFAPERMGRFPGDINELWSVPLGPAAIISPWNFPLAICAGMTVAALVTGNPAIVKPAEQTPGIAKLLCDILWEAGAPKDVLQFLPGPGEVVGAALVRDERVAIVAFTGSKAVGLDILAAAGRLLPGQAVVKRVVCEMGGKNAIIVDETADLDEAVLGVRASAFGYAGQKCSACSRAIVVDSVHDAYVRRLVEACKALRGGDPLMPETDIGPVIDAESAAKIAGYVELGKAEATLAYAGPAAPAVRGKPVVPPHVFTGVKPEHRLFQDEIFGPVLAVVRADSFEHAIQLANQSPYRLTGGVFTRTPKNLAMAKQRFRVGNLYLNRGCTGALVARQPFGGWGHSGAGTKAGGADYLRHFVTPVACCENAQRRGFAPAE